MKHPDIARLIENLRHAPAGVGARGGEVHAADIARALPDLDQDGQQLVFSLLGDAKAADVLVETDEPTRETLVAGLTAERLGRLLALLDPDDAADILQAAPEETRAALLATLDEEHRHAVSALGRYEPETAGGIMTTEVVAVTSDTSVRVALAKVNEAEQAETISALFVVDAAGVLVGVVQLKDLLGAPADGRVAELMDPTVISVRADADQEEAARRVEHYRLSSLPVVDAHDRLLGVITVDDIIEVIGEEAEEDVLVLAGTSASNPTKQPLLRRYLARSPWLAITLTGSFGASLLLREIERHWFGPILEDVPSTYKSLLYFIPMIGGMAGNVGSQSSATMVRGFATGEVDPERPMRVLPREVLLGVMIGLSAGLLVGPFLALTSPQEAWLAAVVGVALPCSITVAALSGTLIPFLCERVKIDPAYASGPFLQTMNDLTGYAIYFTVAISLMSVLGVH